jgi:hypothetical protein
MMSDGPPTKIFEFFDIGPLIAELSTKSQAWTVLVSAAAVDDRLQKLLLGKMRTMSNEHAKRIFNGPLARFGPKIDVAYAFELIDDDLHNDLMVIKDIRNEFAHPVELEMNFGSPYIIELVKRLKGWNTSLDAFSLFQQRIKSCADQIDAKLEQILFDSALSNDSRERRMK